MTDAQEALIRAHRDEWARVVATLAKRFGNLAIAEEAAADAFATAAERWPAEGTPPNPGGCPRPRIIPAGSRACWRCCS